MKKITTLVFLMALFCIKSWGQTITLLDPTVAGGFESSTSTFASNGWTAVQSTTNTSVWQVGTAAGVQGGTKAAYMGTATTYTGSTLAAVQHFYRDIAIPAGVGNVQLTFYLKEPTATSAQPLYVFTTTTANTPVSGTVPSTGYTQKFSNTTAYSTYTQMGPIDLSSYAGTTVRLVFTFKSTTATTSANPAIDNVSITYTSPPTISSFSPTSGCPNSGTVVITGTNLNDVRGITIGGTAVSSFTINSATQVTATVGSGTTGTVAVTNLGGTATSTGTYTINPLPGAVGSITGSAEVCPGASLTYSIPASANATSYTWTVPTGWTIASGQGSTSISATAGSAGQNGFITAVANNACGSSGDVSQTLNITPLSATNNTGYTDSSTKTSGNVWVAGLSARDSLHVRKAYLKFPLSGIISGANVISAQLSLTNYATDTISGLVNTVVGIGNTDPITTAAPALSSAITKGTVYNSSTWSDKGTINLALNSTATTDIVNQLAGTGYINLGLIRGNGFSVYRFYGYGNGTNSPTLAVTYSSPANIAIIVDTSTTINTQPTGATYCRNIAATALSVGATGTGTLTYQWYSNTTNSNSGGTAISGATSSSYTPPTSTVGTVYYYVMITGTCGSVNSATATVTVTPLATVNTQPTGSTYCQNVAATALSVGATGTGTLAYQWYSNTTNSNSGGTLISGATSSSYIPSTTAVGTVYYYVTVTGNCATTTSATASITVNPATAITANPATSATYCQNATATALSVTATGTGTLTYQWYSNTTNSTSGGTPINNATFSTYTPATVNAGTIYYYAIATSTCSTATSTMATVIVNATTVINSQPSPATQTVCQNTTATSLSVSVVGANLTYQWYSNTTNSTSGGTTLSGATSAGYTPSTATAGTLYYYVTITGSCGSVTSTTATVIVNPATAIISQPSVTGQTLCKNTTATALSVSASGTSLAYQWYSNTTNSTSGGKAISGATSATYTPVTTTVGTLYYYVLVTGSCLPTSITSSASGAITVTPITSVTSNPATSATYCQNATATALSVTATGTGTLTYQWYSNTTNSTSGGTAISGATSATYIPSTTAAGTLYYYVIVSGTCSTATSTTAAIVVNAATSIATNPVTSTSYCQNTTATALSVSASGTNLAYQWYSNTTNSTSGGTAINGATASTYIPVTTTSGTFYFYVIVNGTCGSVTSTTAAIVVNAATVISTQPLGATYCLNAMATTLSVTATGTGTLTYQWYSNTTNSTSGGTIISGATSATYTPSTATAGTLYYYVIVTGTCGNTISNTATVVVNQKSTNPTSASASSSSICVGSSTLLTLNGGGGGTGTTIKWYTGSCGGTLVGTGNNLSVSPTSTTTYYGRYEDGAPCNYTTTCASVTITVNALPTVTAITGFSNVGTGKSISLSDATTGGVWSVNNTSYATVNSTTANPVTVTGVAVGNPVITYTITNATTSCSANAIDTIHVYNSSLAVYVTKQVGVYSLASTWYINRKDGNGLVPADVPPGNDDNITVKHDLTLDQTYNGTSLAYFVITTGGTMTIQPNIYFSTAGIVNFGGNHVTVQSNSSGTGAIGAITNTAGKIDSATNVTAERYINLNTNNGNRSGRAWRLVTAPVTGTTIGNAWQEGIIYDGTNYHPMSSPGTIASITAGIGTNITGSKQGTSSTANGHAFDFWSDIANGSPSILYYTPDSVSGKWNPYTSINGTDIASQPAYMLFVRGDKSKLSPPNAGATTLRATGILKQGSQTTTVPGNNAYTVVGNPYASPIDFEKVYSSSSNISHKFQIWNANLGTYGAYQLVDGTGGAGNYTIVPSPVDGTPRTVSQYIPSGAGILIQPLSSAGGAVTITEAAKAPTQTVFVNPYSEREETDRMLYINLNLKNSDTTSSLADGVLANFNNGYSSGIDGDDALKQANFNENISIFKNNTDLIVEALPDVQTKDTLQLRLWNVTNRQYQLQLKSANFTSNAGVRAYLEDNYLQTKQEVNLLGNLTTVNFSVNSDTSSRSQSRFRIVFQKDALLLPLTLTSLKAVPQNGGVNISWLVSNEVNMKQYVAERSVDGGKTYTAIATVPAKNINSISTTYSGFDAAPNKGDNLYRIRMEASGGTFTYSGVVKVTFNESTKGSQIRIYPNPVGRDGKINVQFTNLMQGDYLLSVYSSDGRNISQRKITIAQSNSAQSEVVNLSSTLASGSYQARITDSKGVTVFTDKILVVK